MSLFVGNHDYKKKKTIFKQYYYNYRLDLNKYYY